MEGGKGTSESEETMTSQTNKGERIMAQYRQGDVFLNAVDEIPEGLKPVKAEHGRLIAARGEVTGHHHSVAVEDAELLTTADAAQMYLRVHRETQITHQEHAAITLQPGDYRVTIQREYTPQEIRRVAD